MGKVLQQNLFDVEAATDNSNKFLSALEKNKKKDWLKELSLPYFPEPANDNEKLFNYQYEYLINGSKDSFKKMQALGWIVMERLLWKWCKKNKTFIEPEKQTDIILNACEYVFRRFSDVNRYCVQKNFITVLNDGLRHGLFYKTEKDNEVLLEPEKIDTMKFSLDLEKQMVKKAIEKRLEKAADSGEAAYSNELKKIVEEVKNKCQI